MDIFEAALARKLGNVLIEVYHATKCDPYLLAKTWLKSQTKKEAEAFTVSVCSQSPLYITEVFLDEIGPNKLKEDEKHLHFEEALYWLGYFAADIYFSYHIMGDTIADQYDVADIIDHYPILHTQSDQIAWEMIQENYKVREQDESISRE